MTYTGQGVNKRGVHPQDHTIVYTGDRPVQFENERERGLTRKPVRVQPAGPRHKLDNASRLNYAKLYTVEYNVKVWFIGKIHEDSQWQFTADYNQVHPPMRTRGLRPVESLEDTYGHTGGGTSSYSTQIPPTQYAPQYSNYQAQSYDTNQNP
jgi:hypothetical protein